jgi:hypothetical protein
MDFKKRRLTMVRDNNESINESSATQSAVTQGTSNSVVAVDGLKRREWLKTVMMGSIGVGLFGISLPSYGEEQKLLTCPRVLRLSKDLSAEIRQYSCKPCECAGERVYMIAFEFKGLLKNNIPCDESGKLIPENSTMLGSLRMNLRRGLCPKTKKSHLWGCHEGKFELYGPNTGMLFAGSLSGAFGFDPRTNGNARCCWPYGEGVLRGKGVEKLQNCEICSIYHLKIPFNMDNPCASTPPKMLTMHIDGTVMCPC